MIVSVRRGDEPARTFAIDQPQALIGKHPECDVLLADVEVSRHHARLLDDDGCIVLEDLGSTNGTLVAGQKASGRIAIGPEDSIEIGPFVLIVRATAAPAAGLRLSLGPLDPFLGDDGVSEVMVNGPGEIYIERDGRLELVDARFPSEEALQDLVREIAADVGRRIDERRPMLDARLADGSRVNAVMPPLALRGTYLTIRRFPRHRLTMEQLVSSGTLTARMAEFLRAAVGGRTSLLVSGGAGSGKTTILSALCAFFSPYERIVTIEDAAELKLPQRHVLPLESKPQDLDGGGGVSIRDLVRNALRMRPDRIVVGEVRGDEALDMLQALNTGHEGSLSTIHANSPREALARLETMVLLAGSDLPARAVREQIVGAVKLIVHSKRTSEGKRVISSIAEVSGLEGDQFTMGEIFARDEARGLVATGYVPRLRDRLVERGVAIDNAWFLR